MSTKVYLEIGSTKVFVCAVDWPGWCRSAKTEDAAIEALAAYVPRFEPVAARAGVSLPKSAGRFDVVERLKGSATTDFGAPGGVASRDREPLAEASASRLAAFVEAAWAPFDDVASARPPP